MELTQNFQPQQILCLEHAGICLYAEVIQVVVSRRLCWVRPLLLGASQASEAPLPLTDLRSCADLLWPIKLFRPAIDTEVIPLWTQLLASEPQLESSSAAQQRLHQFIYQVWQAEKSVF